MEIVLITGSREAAPEMKECVDCAVRWCLKSGYRIVVGDTSEVDEAVRRARC
jgi:hypothetical protein